MKTSLIALAGVLAGATMLVAAAPASAHDRIAFGISVGVPVAPVAYVAPPAYYAPPPAPVVVGGPVVEVGAPYYGPDWRYYHGYRGGYYYHGYNGYHGNYGYHGGYHGGHR
jgi:hypothetical protein